MLSIENLCRIYNGKRAVDDVTLTIEPGSFVGIIGRSGAGKSTLLRLINRLAEPSGGQIRWNGKTVTALEGRDLRAWRAQCAMIFQQFNIVGRLDVLSNVLVGRLNHTPVWQTLLGLWSDEDRLLALSALEQFEIGTLAAQRAETLSGGQQQRVAIARALVQQPDIILADEPIASLDPHNTKVVMDGLLRLNKHFGLTVLCNLHDLDIATDYCDRLIGMAQGRVVFDGSPSDLTADVIRDLYGLEAGAVVLPQHLPVPAAVASAAFA